MSNNKILDKFKNGIDIIYEPQKIANENDCIGSMLWILPGLDTNGVVLVSIEMIQMILDLKYVVYVISSEDGIYREQLLTRGVPVIIRPYVICDKQYRKNLQKCFDVVFISSICCYSYIYYFINTDTKVYWWIHETEEQLNTLPSIPDLKLLSDNIQLLAVTEKVAIGIRERFQMKVPLLHIWICDCYSPQKRISSDKITFLIPSAYTYIKGQDILLQAIAKLPEAYKLKSEFIFCGYQLEGQKQYLSLLEECAAKLNNVFLLQELSKEQVYSKYKEVDCVVAPSRVDAAPATIVEGMMFHKLCLCSSGAGISQYMTDCIDGFVFENENVSELYKRLLFIIEEYPNLMLMAEKGHKIYEHYFSKEVVKERLQELLSIKNPN